MTATHTLHTATALTTTERAIRAVQYREMARDSKAAGRNLCAALWSRLARRDERELARAADSIILAGGH